MQPMQFSRTAATFVTVHVRTAETRVRYSPFCVNKGHEFSVKTVKSFDLYTIDTVRLFTQF